MEARHHCTDRNAQHVGNLPVGEPFDVGQEHGDPEVLGEVGQGLLDVVVHQALEHDRLRRLAHLPVVRNEVPVEVELLGVVGRDRDRLPAALPVAADEEIGHDLEEPRLEVRPRLETVPGTEGPEVGLLHQILRVGRIARHTKRRAVEGIGVDERLVLKAVDGGGQRLRRSGHAQVPCLGKGC